MKGYFYLLIFLTNVILSFAITSSKEFFFSISQFYTLYIGTTLIFLVDWFITRPRFNPENLLDPSKYLQSNFHLITNFGDRLMALAIIAVCDIVIYGLALPNEIIYTVEVEFGTPLILVLISIFLIPVMLLKFVIEPIANRSHDSIYLRIKEGILTNKIVIPVELHPYIRTKRGSEQNLDFSTTSVSNLSLQAYPNPDQEVKTQKPEVIIKDSVQITDENPREVLQNAHKTFILSLFPELSDYIERKPVSIQTTLFYEILNKVLKNEPECRTVLGL